MSTTTFILLTLIEWIVVISFLLCGFLIKSIIFPYPNNQWKQRLVWLLMHVRGGQEKRLVMFRIPIFFKFCFILFLKLSTRSEHRLIWGVQSLCLFVGVHFKVRAKLYVDYHTIIDTKENQTKNLKRSTLQDFKSTPPNQPKWVS